MIPDLALYAAFMDSMKNPFLFVDTDHIIRYMNRAARAHYAAGEKLLGRSILACHNEDSQRQIVEIYEKMKDGLEEQLITDNARHQIYMRAVRDQSGNLLGYYERYEPPRQRDEKDR
ncbi:MAG: PAS domain-containing protein [Deltaproteobacteria bacterium]|nr:PAS domain-containing protein [Deltaproteobacteria bacterium]